MTLEEPPGGRTMRSTDLLWDRVASAASASTSSPAADVAALRRRRDAALAARRSGGEGGAPAPWLPRAPDGPLETLLRVALGPNWEAVEGARAAGQRLTGAVAAAVAARGGSGGRRPAASATPVDLAARVYSALDEAAADHPLARLPAGPAARALGAAGADLGGPSSEAALLAPVLAAAEALRRLRVEPEPAERGGAGMPAGLARALALALGLAPASAAAAAEAASARRRLGAGAAAAEAGGERSHASSHALTPGEALASQAAALRARADEAALASGADAAYDASAADAEAELAAAAALGGPKALASEASARWLLVWCASAGLGGAALPASDLERHARSDEVAALAAGLAQAVLDPAVSDDELAARSFGALGDGAFDKIPELLAARAALATNLTRDVRELLAEEAGSREGGGGGRGGRGGPQGAPGATAAALALAPSLTGPGSGDGGGGGGGGGGAAGAKVGGARNGYASGSGLASTEGIGVSIATRSDQLTVKAGRKAERKKQREEARAGGARGDGGGGWADGMGADGPGPHGAGDAAASSGDPGTWVGLHGLLPLAEREARREMRHKTMRLGGVEFRLGDGVDGPRGRQALPAGTERKLFKGYEEIRVPPTKTGGLQPGEALAPISELPPWARLAFAGYTTLNRIQSRTLPTLFGSNENVLVCAPTGAGKTNIAMLAVLREIGQHMRAADPSGGDGAGGDGVTASGGGVRRAARGGPVRVGDRIDKGSFKVVYVAPMKALAAEVTQTFGKRLAPLGLTVRELTGDTQLSRKELAATQMIVTTPEKWDVVTRKGAEGGAAGSVTLLIIDEVHLLNDDRGPVIETLVARTTRAVESSQRMIRLVGLSATLPNYRDVSDFLGVNPSSGLFHFDATYRPVPLSLEFIGATEKNQFARNALFDEIAYDKISAALREGKQAMVFVHSRKQTGQTARSLGAIAGNRGERDLFDPQASAEAREDGASRDAALSAVRQAQQELRNSRNVELREVFERGFGIHHAGMLRSDRSLVEKAFSSGAVKVLVCTATLAWGVNLPAHVVVIKGTQLYAPAKGGHVDLGMLDVQQIFGRAGRPQFAEEGKGIILTSHDKLGHYLGLLTNSVPIESRFVDRLADHLNAELVLGTVSSLEDATRWLGYTYLHQRARKNPLAYGLTWEELADDPRLVGHRRALVRAAARVLEGAKMARLEERTGAFHVTELGRVASYFYVSHETVETFNARLHPDVEEREVLEAISRAGEFDQFTTRDDEVEELERLAKDDCPWGARGDVREKHVKASVLIQAHVSRSRIDGFSLSSDAFYAASNAPRLARAAFEACSRRGWSSAARACLALSLALERRLPPEAHELWQLEGTSGLQGTMITALETAGLDCVTLSEMPASDLSDLLRWPAAGPKVLAALSRFPRLLLHASPRPVTRGVLSLDIVLAPDFAWSDGAHGSSLRWHLWVENEDQSHVFHAEQWVVPRAAAINHLASGGGGGGGDSLARATFGFSPTLGRASRIEIPVPIFDPLPERYWVRAVSDSFVGSETLVEVDLRDLTLPEPPSSLATTPLLELDPLPTSAIALAPVRAAGAPPLFPPGHLNRLQTQAFFRLFHSDENVLVGAPAGSGKALCAELAILRLLRVRAEEAAAEGGPRAAAGAAGPRVLYLAACPAAVRERARDWRRRLGASLGLRVAELGGGRASAAEPRLESADVLCATPEAWDAASRAVLCEDERDGAGGLLSTVSGSSLEVPLGGSSLGLVVVDELHLLGSSGASGATLEAVVARLRARARPPRLVALCAAVANADDLARWLGVEAAPGGAAGGLFSFRPSSRPVPLEAHIQGYAGRLHAPRAAAMGRPCYQAINRHAGGAQSVVFVSGRKQARLTAEDLITAATADDRSRGFVAPDGGEAGSAEAEALEAAEASSDPVLKRSLPFGVGVYHDGLRSVDRALVLHLFSTGRLPVLVASSELAHAASISARLVVVKGTERYDSATGRYVDYSVPEVLQMMGKAGRPGFDPKGIAVIMTAEAKKSYYKKFLYEPYPVESALAAGLDTDRRAFAGPERLTPLPSGGGSEVRAAPLPPPPPTAPPAAPGALPGGASDADRDVPPTPLPAPSNVPVPSAPAGPLPDLLLAEVASGSVCSMQAAVDWLATTFLATRLAKNRAFYGVRGAGEAGVAAWLSALALTALEELERAGAIELGRAALGPGPGSLAGTSAPVAGPELGEPGDVRDATASGLAAPGVRARRDARRRGRAASLADGDAPSPPPRVLPTTSVAPTRLGLVAARHAISYLTGRALAAGLARVRGPRSALEAVCAASVELDATPVRYGDERSSQVLRARARWPDLATGPLRPPAARAKAFLLVQAALGPRGPRGPLAEAGSDAVVDARGALAASGRAAAAGADLAAAAADALALRAFTGLSACLADGSWGDGEAAEEAAPPHAAAPASRTLAASRAGDRVVLDVGPDPRAPSQLPEARGTASAASPRPV